MDKMEPIPINIWDDFYEDDYLEEGEIQETYIYVEDTEISHDARHKILESFLKYIKENFDLAGVNMWLEYHDSKKLYPNLVGTENEWCLYERWEIKVQHLPHKKINEIITELDKRNLVILDIPIVVYSES
jgi:hypothetical protein